MLTLVIKRPAIEEVLEKIDMLAHDQFGNWCIQHICEHGAPIDRNRAIEHIILNAADYSTDQFASKIVEKCLKVCGSNFLDRYLSRVSTGRSDRPRMPLVDSMYKPVDPFVPFPRQIFNTKSYTSCWRSVRQLFDPVDPLERWSTSTRARCCTCQVLVIRCHGRVRETLLKKLTVKLESTWFP